MFEGINNINWEKLPNFFDTAKDLPDKLIALIQGTQKEREDALYYFWEYMYHQNTVCEATTYSVPFLFEVLEHKECTIHNTLINMLRAFAVREGESLLPWGYDLKIEEQLFFDNLFSRSALFSSEDGRNTYYEVNKRADKFIKYLGDEYDSNIRISAAFAIAHFAQSLTSYHTQVAEIIITETNEEILRHLIICYGMLGRFANSEVDVKILLPYLDHTYSQKLRLSTAIAITTITASKTPNIAVQIIFQAINELWEVSNPFFDYWYEGDLLEYGVLVLSLLGNDYRDEILNVLYSALNTIQGYKFTVPITLLNVAFPKLQSNDRWRSSDFDHIQKRSLQILLLTDNWTNSIIARRFLSVSYGNCDYLSKIYKFLRDVMEDNYILDTSNLSGLAGSLASWELKKDWVLAKFHDEVKEIPF